MNRLPRQIEIPAACAIAAILIAIPAAAQEEDVLVQQAGDRLITGTGDPTVGLATLGPRVARAFFGSSYVVDDPGFNSIGTSSGSIPPGAAALPGGADLRWDFLPMKVDGLLSNLLYWNGIGTAAGALVGAALGSTRCRPRSHV